MGFWWGTYVKLMRYTMMKTAPMVAMSIMIFDTTLMVRVAMVVKVVPKSLVPPLEVEHRPQHR